MARSLRALPERLVSTAAKTRPSRAPHAGDAMPEGDGRDGAPSLLKDKRGAVYVEFLGVFFPLFTMFLALVQFAFVQTASILVRHAALRAARTASVILHDNPAFYGGATQGNVTPQKQQMAADFAKIPLKTLGNAEAATVTFDKPNYGRNDLIKATVRYPYGCNVPVGKLAACGADGERLIEAEASMPNQGADFIY
ncbi:TadE/TadG family type IV pilus assembly protein [Chondromyces apiculatus]|uniref:Pilus assembly protein n=1 Tax=Chondromyces apiculatus DSM 436 TaxID=1192034 RepID=A0A017TBJ3_9BACT|nr:pilus assembly protein [Chondromyces apiculatus]EYF06584.1 Hypothetical protein CAP_1714 [Chondromyces apiculatus DSM 436]